MINGIDESALRAVASSVPGDPERDRCIELAAAVRPVPASPLTDTLRRTVPVELTLNGAPVGERPGRHVDAAVRRERHSSAAASASFARSCGVEPPGTRPKSPRSALSATFSRSISRRVRIPRRRMIRSAGTTPGGRAGAGTAARSPAGEASDGHGRSRARARSARALPHSSPAPARHPIHGQIGDPCRDLGRITGRVLPYARLVSASIRALISSGCSPAHGPSVPWPTSPGGSGGSRVLSILRFIRSC